MMLVGCGCEGMMGLGVRKGGFTAREETETGSS
jgi:hypothetical protein